VLKLFEVRQDADPIHRVRIDQYAAWQVERLAATSQ
jgi:hypothetical protein